MRKIYKSQKGFSLIELMVSLTIFSIVMTVAMGTLLILIDANGKAQALSGAMTNVSFAMDSMSRSLRTGKNFKCANSISTTDLTNATVGNCTNGSAIVFTPGFESTWRMAYRRNGTVIEQRIEKGSTNGTWTPITSDMPPAAVTVSELKFSISGSENNQDANDENQPRINLLVKGSVQNGLEAATAFSVQTNVTQRVLDF
jgi:prepilin-type N-terminal cleavage/methylation domain-containing protein